MSNHDIRTNLTAVLTFERDFGHTTKAHHDILDVLVDEAGPVIADEIDREVYA